MRPRSGWRLDFPPCCSRQRSAGADFTSPAAKRCLRYSRVRICLRQTITVSKDYSFVEQDLLAKEHEADILREQMARDLVAIAMRRLTRLK